jgi:hypothetical protein
MAALVLVVTVLGITLIAVVGFTAKAVVEIFRIRKGQEGPVNRRV